MPELWFRMDEALSLDATPPWNLGAEGDGNSDILTLSYLFCQGAGYVPHRMASRVTRASVKKGHLVPTRGTTS